MYVTPCPKCGREPKIEECLPNRKYKNGIRRRICMCPNYCSVIPQNNMYSFMFTFEGDGDDNVIYKEWNKAIKCYLNNINKPWYERNYNWR